MSEASGLQVLRQPLPAHCHRNSPFARCSVETPKRRYPQTPSQPARALESTRTAELAVLMKRCLTEKQAAPGSMYKTIGFMNMHKVLFLETIAAVVIGAEQAGGEGSSSRRPSASLEVFGRLASPPASPGSGPQHEQGPQRPSRFPHAPGPILPWSE